MITSVRSQTYEAKKNSIDIVTLNPTAKRFVNSLKKNSNDYIDEELNA